MKNSIIKIFTMCLLASPSINAQEDKNIPASEFKLKPLELGFRFMPTFTSFNMTSNSAGAVASDVTLGYGGGIALGLNITKHVGLQAEAIYNSFSQKYKDPHFAGDVKIRYVNIPFLLSINTNKTKPVNFNLVVGPQLGINVGSSVNKTGGSSSDTLVGVFAIKKNDIGLAYGAGLEFMLNKDRTMRLGLGYRGVYGFTNISNTSQVINNPSYYIIEKANIRSNSVYIGFAFLF